MLNINNFLENMEDIELGSQLRKLVLIDSLKYTQRTKFLEKGTGGLK